MTTHGMTETRFAELAEAFGGDLRRWPEAEVAAARAWVEAHPAAADRALFQARQMDAVLYASRNPVVSTALRDRVIASAAMAGRTARTAWPSLRKLLWIGGAGWAAAACAGVVFGTTLGGRIADDAQAFAVFEQSQGLSLDDVEVLG